MIEQVCLVFTAWVLWVNKRTMTSYFYSYLLVDSSVQFLFLTREFLKSLYYFQVAIPFLIP